MGLVDVIALAPLSIGFLLWFCLPPERGSGARPPTRADLADLAGDDPKK
jgi:hypothetical protein